SYDSKSYSVATQVAGLKDVKIANSGTKMYVTAFNSYIYEYTLSTPYDVSSASYVQSFDDTNRVIFFKDDGLVMFGSTGGTTLKKYVLSTAWDVSTASLDSSAVLNQNIEGIYFKPDGTKIYNLNTLVTYQYSTSTPWRIDSYSETVITDTPILANIEITANGTNVIDLSDIDFSPYPNDLIFTYQLDRDSTGDTSPTISEHSITWEGIPKGVWIEVDGDTTDEDGAVLNLELSGYDEYKLELNTVPSVNNAGFKVTYNSDGSSLYDTFFRSDASDASVSSTAYQQIIGTPSTITTSAQNTLNLWVTPPKLG
ncbi:unnamed protein product, partial [marine sediment metagenome]